MGRKRGSNILQRTNEPLGEITIIHNIEQIINRRIRDIEILRQSIEEENIPELKLVWEYQINLNFGIIDALMRHDTNTADAYIEEIIRSTKRSEIYRITH